MPEQFITEVSPNFFPVLKMHEGEVLRAYRDPGGFITIGTGLTAASGVIVPKMGMTITSEKNRELTMKAVNRNYAPRVRKNLPTRKQHVFDGATSFDFNTGRIHNASWVDHFINGAMTKAEMSFKLWVKQGSRTLPGLVTRREDEWDIIAHNRYPSGAGLATSTLTTVADHRQQFLKAGYDPDASDVVERFQRDNGLTVDGLIGPATRSTLVRVLEGKNANNATAGAGAGGAVAGGGGEVATTPDGLSSMDGETLLWAIGLGAGFAAVVLGLSLVWRYRGPLFAWLPEPIKDLTERFGLVLGRRIAA